MNTFGNIFRLTTFGESHGVAVGAVVDGCPAGIPFDLETLRRDLARRRPGQAYTTERNELDEPEVLSGVFEGLTLGSPIAVIVRNHDQRSKDYNRLKDLYRPSHADYTYQQKYGVRDHRGGGRSSARETLARVIGGSVAQMVLAEKTSIRVKGAVTTLGTIQTERPLTEMQVDNIYASPVRCDDPDVEGKMAEYLEQLRAEGDSTGGIVSIQVDGVEAGLGEPIYRKLNSILAAAMMSINGATGFEMGAGFAVANRRGSENNDQWSEGGGGLRTTTNNSGGVQGGISNGMPIVFRVAFKPPSSIAKEQTHGTTSGETVEHTIAGRHDPSIVIRALPVVEAMTLLVLADMWLQSKAWS
ncbi:MAG: chorismate synthase [Ignavibacteriae bacterium]|nr:chorismate synthase [Ignavibacteriota bacterium]MCB9215970.1 chorismate synthase [Ignavibacteria bacterium]